MNDYSIPVYGECRGLLCAEIEIRQDQIAEREGQQAWAARLARTLTRAADTFAEHQPLKSPVYTK